MRERELGDLQAHSFFGDSAVSGQLSVVIGHWSVVSGQCSEKRKTKSRSSNYARMNVLQAGWILDLDAI